MKIHRSTQGSWIGKASGLGKKTLAIGFKKRNGSISSDVSTVPARVKIIEHLLVQCRVVASIWNWIQAANVVWAPLEFCRYFCARISCTNQGVPEQEGKKIWLPAIYLVA